LEVLVAEGQTVAVETPIARIGTPSATEPAPRAEPLATPAGASAASAAPAGPPSPKPTPVAARLLAEHGLAAGDIAVHGPRLTARLTKQDVLVHLAATTRPPAVTTAPQAEPKPRQTPLTPLTPMRRAIADHMTRAYATIPHGQTVMAADLSALSVWRDANKDAFARNEGASLTFTVFFVRALAHALMDRTDGAAVNIGVAVALERGGLIVPVLRDAASLSLAEIARRIHQLAAKARSGQLAPDAAQGALMTVTNVGSFGNLTASPIIPVGQLGILAPGLVERRPLPTSGGGIRPGHQCLLSLMFDRRAFDDFAADRFLRGIVSQLSAVPSTV
ncbi:MAG TPA: 2-oxo acid dehydrogenase subunit E2, partial [Chloroflexota bacterium]|nr:2-oxo acid dehydrogenase subunit E2 [Chloroflexota bacterium]